jgi:basic membrane protein A
MDIGGEYDRSFNELTLRGAREAAAAEGLQIDYVVSKTITDYAHHINRFVNEGCRLILTIGFLMADVTAEAAKANPDVHFAIVDVEYLPGFGCDPDLINCYEEDLDNVTSLMFSEYEAGYLVGVLAGCMSQSKVIGSVAAMEIPPVVDFVVGYQQGAGTESPGIETLNVYIPDFNDPATGLQAGQQMIAMGADIIFAVGGNTGNGGLLAAHQAGV